MPRADALRTSARVRGLPCLDRQGGRLFGSCPRTPAARLSAVRIAAQSSDSSDQRRRESGAPSTPLELQCIEGRCPAETPVRASGGDCSGPVATLRSNAAFARSEPPCRLQSLPGFMARGVLGVAPRPVAHASSTALCPSDRLLGSPPNINRAHRNGRVVWASPQPRLCPRCCMANPCGRTGHPRADEVLGERDASHRVIRGVGRS
jgi:hypothetical protein